LDDETFEHLRALMRLAREYHLLELKVESADAVVRLRRRERRAAAQRKPPTPSSMLGRVEEIRAPLVGVFYRAPAPDAPPYVEVGDWVEPGQTVGLIEAMKVFSEITTEIAGRVIAIAAGNGELVEAGQALMVVELAE
jgi:biotin carboxyl carrier protein